MRKPASRPKTAPYVPIVQAWRWRHGFTVSFLGNRYGICLGLDRQNRSLIPNSRSPVVLYTNRHRWP